MKTLKDELFDIFAGGELYSVTELIDLLGHRYNEDEVEDELANMTHDVQLTAWWYPRKDENLYEGFDGKLD